MALPAGGSSAPTVSAYEGGERVGGKLLNRLHRRNRATPYDRPLAARGSSWISKVVVDPAKKLIAASARRFLSSVFCKRLPAPPPTPLLPAPGAIPELSNGLQDPVQQNEVLQSAGADSHYVMTEDSSVPTELLQLLKQNIFTRPEVDRLTKLLESKAVDLPVPDDVRRVESSLSMPVMEYRKQEQYLKDSSVENWSQRDQSHTVLEEDITFPTELAKEYTSRRISIGSPSLLSYLDQGINEDGDLANGVPSVPNSRVMSLATKTSRYTGDQENSLTTPRFRARSAIHEMASSRIHTPPFHRGSGSSGKSSASPTLLKQNGELGWKEPSRKRSSAVLEDFGSGGTVRRFRRKYGLVSHKVDLPFGENYNACSGQPFSLTHKHSFMDDWRLKGSKLAEGVDNTNNSSTRSSHLSSKSSQHAAKGKVVEAKLIADRQRTPFMLTKDMLSGKALKSLESLDSLMLLPSTQDGENLVESLRDVVCTYRAQNEAKENDPEKSLLQQNEAKENGSEKSHLQLEVTSQTQNGAEVNGSEKSFLQHDFTFQKQNEAEENGSEKSLFQLDFTSLKHNGVDENVTEKSHPQLDTTFYMDRDHILGSPAPSASRTISVVQKKHAFMMSVPEDFIDMGEDADCNGPAAEALLKETEENKTLLAEGNPGPSGKSVLDNAPSLVETRKAPPETVTLSDNSIVSVGGDGTTASVSLPLQSGPCPPSSFSLEKSKDVENPSASISEASQPKFSPSMQPEPFRPIRLGDAADVSLQVPESGKHEVNNLQESVNANEKLETKSSVVFSSSMSATCSASIIPGPSNMQNGPVHLSPSTISSTPSLVSTIFGNQASTDAPVASSSAVSIPVATQNSAISSSLILPASQPSVPSVSTFTFGASDNTSTASVPSVSTFTFSASDKASTASVPSVSTITSGGASDKTSTALVPAASFAEASVTKNEAYKEVNPISALGSLIHPSTDKSQPQDAGNESMLSTRQSFEVVSGAATVSQSIPFQFGSSTAPFPNGTSGITPFIANTASSSSSSPATNLFGSVPSFGLSSSTSSSSEIKSVTSASSGLPSSTITYGSTVSSGPNAVSSSSGNAPSAFNFGAGSSGTTSSVTPGMFNFGATSSSNMSSSTVFGSTLQTPNSAPFGAAFNQTPSSVFAFGASSSLNAPNIPAMAFGASSFVNAPNIPKMAFGATSTPTPSIFTNQDQMNGEDSMAEDPVQSLPIAGFNHQLQQHSVPPPAAGSFSFGSTAPPAAPAFQFGGGAQQTQVGFQNNSFQGSGSLEFNAGGSFSLGSTGGGDKSGRKYVKVNRNRNRNKK